MYKFHDFAEKANDALNAAINAAENLGHTYIGSEHLLLGLLLCPDCVAHEVLTSQGVTAEAVEYALQTHVGIGTPTVLTDKELTPRCKYLLQSAITLAKASGLSCAGTEHLLIAMAKDPSSYAMKILAAMNVSGNALIQETTRRTR